MDIVLYPDPRLRAKNAPVTDFDAELEATTREMFQLMYTTKGVGLAAPQVGLNIRLMVYNPSGSDKQVDEEVVLCNPKIVWKSKVKEDGQEGCLSFLSICGQVTRPVSIKVQAQGLKGEPVELELEEWEARIFQHELDHLDGILFIDRMSLASKSLVKGDLEDMVQEYKNQLASS
ncbi:MAG: peptide deformylase [Planctomycetota bacterium]|jgi:peptide deformylase|nr:peptide deformylase [Planctomycetota bacterium]